LELAVAVTAIVIVSAGIVFVIGWLIDRSAEV
jgi:hypothetical protein